MNRIFTYVSVFFLVLAGTSGIYAQSSDALDYMKSINEESRIISVKVWSYISAAAHSKSTRKIEKSRADVLNSIADASNRISRLPAFQGDASYRDSALVYLNLSYHVFNEDYANIVNMEEVSEQSYDLMEAYMLARDMANDKLDKALAILVKEQEKFAVKNNITLLKEEDELSKKMNVANEVYDYYNVLYLIFFKSFKQEVFLMEATQSGDVNAIEQNKNALGTYANEGLSKLASTDPYKNDKSLLESLRTALEFYVSESKDAQVIVDFYLIKEKFEKIKTTFESKKKSDITQSDVDQYNNSIKEFNDAVNQYNSTNDALNKKRAVVVEKWNQSVDIFLNKHVPN